MKEKPKREPVAHTGSPVVVIRCAPGESLSDYPTITRKDWDYCARWILALVNE